MISPLHGRSSARRARTGRQRPLGTLVVLTLLLSQRAFAQSETVGRVEGVVFDSVHARPLADAHVVAVGAGTQSEVRREATSDSAGKYHLDSLPLGRYIVGFENALLDSLEVTLSPREVTVMAGHIATLDLALPSAAKLRSAVCLGAALPAETGVIFGQVVSAEAESPLAGVELGMEWRDLSVDRSTLRPISRQRSESVVTDANGWYRMCGVPTGTWVSMQVQRDKQSGPVFRARVEDTLGIAIRHLSLATETPRSNEPTRDNRASTPLKGTATLSGVVRGPGGVPVASAEVRVRGTGAEGRTDELGSFTLGALPGGTQELEVRHVGYAVADLPVDLRGGATATVSVSMRRIVNLDSVLVVASRPKYPDFYQHTKAGFGIFLGPEVIAKERVSRTSDIVEKLPGFRVEQRGYRAVVVSTRQVGLSDCVSTIVVDGARVLDPRSTVNDVSPAAIGAIEVYRAGEENMAPADYHIGACGGIVIWTKR